MMISPMLTAYQDLGSHHTALKLRPSCYFADLISTYVGVTFFQNAQAKAVQVLFNGGLFHAHI